MRRLPFITATALEHNREDGIVFCRAKFEGTARLQRPSVPQTGVGCFSMVLFFEKPTGCFSQANVDHSSFSGRMPQNLGWAEFLALRVHWLKRTARMSNGLRTSARRRDIFGQLVADRNRVAEPVKRFVVGLTSAGAFPNGAVTSQHSSTISYPPICAEHSPVSRSELQVPDWLMDLD